MADITDPTAVRFSNERIRPLADKLSQVYYLGVDLDDQWTALGGGQTALDALRVKLKDWAERARDAYDFASMLRHDWNALASPIPNTADTIIDGSESDSRQSITGAQANNVFNRAIELNNWLDTGDFAGGGSGGGAHRNTVLEAAFMLAADLATTEGGNVINRINEQRSNYEASSNAVLSTILAVAVNTTV